MMFERSWKYRRIAFFLILGVSLVLLIHVVIWGKDDPLRLSSLQTLMLLILGSYGTYMTGAILDDKNKGKEIVAQSAVDQATPSSSETSVKIEQ